MSNFALIIGIICVVDIGAYGAIMILMSLILKIFNLSELFNGRINPKIFLKSPILNRNILHLIITGQKAGTIKTRHDLLFEIQNNIKIKQLFFLLIRVFFFYYYY